MKQIIGCMLLLVTIFGLVLVGMLIWQFGTEWTMEQGSAGLQACLPRLKEMARDAMQQMGRGMKAFFRFLRHEFDRGAHYGAGMPPQLCESLQEAFGEEKSGWWCAVCPILEKVENFFR